MGKQLGQSILRLLKIYLSSPGVEPGLSRPQRDVLTARRCGLLAEPIPPSPGPCAAFGGARRAAVGAVVGGRNVNVCDNSYRSHVQALAGAFARCGLWANELARE